MGERSAIEWTNDTWNPWQGCHHVSEGCRNCYMFREKKHYGQNPNIVVRSKPATFNLPLKLKGPRVFVCSWSDFFIEEADPWRDEAWRLMANRPDLIFQIVTKRPERIKDCLPYTWGLGWNNIWLGVSIENQKTADERIPILLQTPAAVRWISAEPLIGPINMSRWIPIAARGIGWDRVKAVAAYGEEKRPGLDWCVLGGESGPGARPMHPDWARSIRDQCQAAGVPFFFKQGSKANWSDFKNFESFPIDLQIREFPNAKGS